MRYYQECYRLFWSFLVLIIAPIAFIYGAMCAIRDLMYPKRRK